MTPENVAAIQKWFSEYCREFDSEDEDVRRNMSLKEDHTYHVCSNILEIGRGESLDVEQMLIAETVALLHDVGRFEQYRQYKTFRDSTSVNHAELGAQIVEDYEVLSPLFPHERNIIAHAVEFHNTFSIPKKLPEDTQFFLKLIRDADKLDIWRVFIEYFAQPESERASAVGLDLPDKPECSPDVLDQISNGKMVRLSSVKTLNDFKVMQLSWVYDINFPTSLNLLVERESIKELASTLPVNDQVEAVVEKVLDFASVRTQQMLSCVPVGA
jgi:hypothetical protein